MSPQGLCWRKVLLMGMKTSEAFLMMNGPFAWEFAAKVCCSQKRWSAFFDPTVEQHLIDLEDVIRRIQGANKKLIFKLRKIVLSEVEVSGTYYIKKKIWPDHKRWKPFVIQPLSGIS